MNKKQFAQPMDKRFVQIEISDEYIDFSFVGETYNQWFYDVPVKEWHKDIGPNWSFRDQLKSKTWFTDEMELFIDKTLSKSVAA